MMISMKKRKGEDGWTFIETLVVIAIILILTSSVGLSTFSLVERSKRAAARSQIDILCLALETYYLDNGRYPSQDQGLKALWEKPVLEPLPLSWNGPYLTKSLGTDPWGGEYGYIQPGPSGLGYGISSFGADGMHGGTGNDADIKSWEENKRK